MSANAATIYAQQFATNVQLLLQQKGSRLRGKVMEKTHQGNQASPVDQVGTVEMQPVVSRFAAMGRVDAPLARRWVMPLSYDLPQLSDTFDELKMIVDPKSSYVESAVAAAGRKMDLTIINGMFGTNYTGVSGATSTSFDSNMAIAVNHGASGAVGLTVKKLREARRLLMTNNVDLSSEEIYCAVDALAHDNLLAESQVISLDYNDRPVLVNGKIDKFLGVNFIHTELVTTTLSSGDTMVPLWVKSGIHLGIWGDISTSISQRHDLQGEPWQAYVKMTVGATRLEEQKIVKILCER